MASLLDLILQLQQQAGVPGMGGGVLGQIDPAWQQQANPRQGYDRYAQGPTVGSTGGAGIQPPWPSAPSAPLPPGMVPQMGLGEAAYTPPQQSGPQQFPQLGGFGVSPGSMVGLPSAPSPAPPLPPARPVQPSGAVGNAPTSTDATLPPNATPTVGYGQQRPQAEPYTPPPQQEPGFFDRIGAGFSNLLNNPSLPGLVQGAQGFATGRYTDPTSIAREYQMATYTNLRKAGYAHADAAMAANNPAVLKQIVEAAYQPTKFEKRSPQEAAYLVGGGGLGGGTQVAEVAKGMTTDQYEAAQARGKAMGEAQSKLPIAKARTEEAIGVIQQMLNHPGRNFWSTGPLAGLAQYQKGTPQYDFYKLVKQATSGSLLDSIQYFRGTGALSDKEGEAGKEASQRMDAASTKEGFDKAANDYIRILRKGYENQQKIASGQLEANEPLNVPGPTTTAPVGGNWTQVGKYRVRPKE